MRRILDETHAREFHCSARSTVPSGMVSLLTCHLINVLESVVFVQIFTNPRVHMSAAVYPVSEYSTQVSTTERIGKFVGAVV